METDLSLNKCEPPSIGEIILRYDLAPVSLQSKPVKKNQLKKIISQSFSNIDYYLSGEVQLEIEWFVHEKERYESSICPDIDNIIKPILDGLSGRKGLLIDDCQIQSVLSSWIDWNKNENAFIVKIKYFSDEYINKEELIFIEISNNLYFPLQKTKWKESQKIIIDQIKKMFEAKELIEKSSNNYYAARGLLPIQNLFHKSRINGFDLLTSEEWDLKIKD